MGVVVVAGGSVTGGDVTGGDVAGGAVAGGVVWIVPPPPRSPSSTIPEPDELDPGATCVLPSLSIVALTAPSTFCSVTAHCASTSLYT